MQNFWGMSGEEKAQACKYYAQNMRNLRTNLGLKQSELAEAIGTTQRHISEIENGKAKVSWTLALALLMVTGRSETYAKDTE